MGDKREEAIEQISRKQEWNPIPLDFLLQEYALTSKRVLILIGFWILVIAVSVGSVVVLSPSDALLGETGQQSLYTFFVMYPPLFLGTLILFWIGFEWGFIPVFLSAFLIAYSSQMPVHWALLFGLAFILGLAIIALCYYSLPVSPRPDNLKRLAYFVSVAFIAALASSLGSFVWSLYHNVTVATTIIIWKAWWTGSFLQSILLVGPLLYLFTPTIERVKERYFNPPKKQVTLNWLYASIASVVAVLTLFILGANILGSAGIEQELSAYPADMEGNFFTVTSSFQIITWISIGLVVAAGMGGIYLVGTWNRQLSEKVSEKTKQLKESEESLKRAVEERDSLLQQVNQRVKDNLTMVLALLELQLKTGELDSVEKILKNSHARLRSLTVVYETMYQTEAIDRVNIKQFCTKLSNRLSQSYKTNNRTIDVTIESEEVVMDIERAVPLAMIINELLVNSYMHAFQDMEAGSILVRIDEDDSHITVTVRDNGVGLPDDFDPSRQKTLGMKLILLLTRQLNGDFNVDTSLKTSFKLRIPSRAAA
ncbi:MAG: histidine kinase dimerization/phosphoacceptor domain -containing protein [Balneolaceae bacterium]|nr:histidine kinase dimerization/phosphoacceptor domain -containing protein [Balneolaceae bacterium]